jgi:hypothetical protein
MTVSQPISTGIFERSDQADLTASTWGSRRAYQLLDCLPFWRLNLWTVQWPEFVPVRELLEVFGRAKAKRQIPFVMLGRKVMFRRESIEAWLNGKEIKSWL